METSASFEARSAPSSYPTAMESAVADVLRFHFEAPRRLSDRMRRATSRFSFGVVPGTAPFVEDSVCEEKMLRLRRLSSSR